MEVKYFWTPKGGFRELPVVKVRLLRDSLEREIDKIKDLRREKFMESSIYITNVTDTISHEMT